MAIDLKQSGSTGSKNRMQKMVKKRTESTGLEGNPEKGWNRYESTVYEKNNKYVGGLHKTIHNKFIDDDGVEGGSGEWVPTGKTTYTKYKALKKPVEKEDGKITVAKGKDISEKRYNRIKKRKSKKFKQQ